jgi:hypothetical protein
LLEELQNKGRYVSDREAKQALTGILVKYEDSQKAEITNKPPQYGYFWINGQIVAYDTTQEDINPQLESDRTKILQCIDVLEALYEKSKHRAAYVTVIKWSTLAPFSYARKFINECTRTNNWRHIE